MDNINLEVGDIVLLKETSERVINYPCDSNPLNTLGEIIKMEKDFRKDYLKVKWENGETNCYLKKENHLILNDINEALRRRAVRSCIELYESLPYSSDLVKSLLSPLVFKNWKTGRELKEAKLLDNIK